MGTESYSERISCVVFDKLERYQKKCVLLFDEVYVHPELRYRSGHAVGYSVDSPGNVARTVLTFMVKPIFSGK